MLALTLLLITKEERELLLPFFARSRTTADVPLRGRGPARS